MYIYLHILVYLSTSTYLPISSILFACTFIQINSHAHIQTYIHAYKQDMYGYIGYINTYIHAYKQDMYGYIGYIQT